MIYDIWGPTLFSPSPPPGKHNQFITSLGTSQDCLYKKHWSHLSSQQNPEFVYSIPSWKSRSSSPGVSLWFKSVMLNSVFLPADFSILQIPVVTESETLPKKLIFKLEWTTITRLHHIIERVEQIWITKRNHQTTKIVKIIDPA